MPLIKKLVPLRDHMAQSAGDHAVPGTEQDSSCYEDFEEYDDEQDSDMEGSILHRPRPKKAPKPPELPQRSDKRASRILENVMLELKSLDGTAAPKDSEQQSVVSDPLELYLSSEEDASFSDDYGDSLLDFDETDCNDGERPASSRPSSRKSQEDTAKIVSFTLVGKPQIIEIYFHPNSTNSSRTRHSVHLDSLPPTSTTSTSPKTRRPTPLTMYPHMRHMSVSSATSSTFQSPSTNPHSSDASLPPRKSSKISQLTSLVTSTALSLHNSFLNSDPFPGRRSSDFIEPPSPTETVHTMKSSTTTSPSAWRKGLQRTLSKARKTSMPKINMSYSHGAAVLQRSDHLRADPDFEGGEKPEQAAEVEGRGEVQRSMTMMTMPTPSLTRAESPITYEDIMRSVSKSPPPTTPSPKEKGRLSAGMILGMGLGRRKSLKGRS